MSCTRGSPQPLSLLPRAARVGAISSNQSSTRGVTISPPCRIRSTPAKAVFTSSHKCRMVLGRCVSVSRPMRIVPHHLKLLVEVITSKHVFAEQLWPRRLGQEIHQCGQIRDVLGRVVGMGK